MFTGQDVTQLVYMVETVFEYVCVLCRGSPVCLVLSGVLFPLKQLLGGLSS